MNDMMSLPSRDSEGSQVTLKDKIKDIVSESVARQKAICRYFYKSELAKKEEPPKLDGLDDCIDNILHLLVQLELEQLELMAKLGVFE